MPVMQNRLALAIAAGLALASLDARAAAVLDPQLQATLSNPGPHRVIVTFSDPSQRERLATLTSQLRLLRELPMAGAALSAAQIQEVAGWEGVESVYLDAPLQYFNHAAGEITGGHFAQDSYGVSGRGVTVAVLDSGVDGNHPDLSFGSKTVQNVKLVADLGLVGASASIENLANTDTSSGHGTHVAGTVAGTGAASANDPRRPRYYDGIAPGASLIGLGAGEGLNILFALEGFDWVLANQQRYGIDIVTNSWGSSNSVYDPNNPINRASFEVYKRGMVVAFAAGNNGPAENTLNPYAIVPWVINVGSGTKARGLSNFSSRGLAGDQYKHIDLIAPGSSICSTRAAGTAIGATGPLVDSTNPAYYPFYHCISGTSMATPFVAGTAALLLEANPELSPDQIERILVETADPMPEFPFHVVGGGYINVRAAVERAAVTPGERRAFLDGITAWSSQGAWVPVADAAAELRYVGNWSRISEAGASEGSFSRASVGKKSAPSLHFTVSGRGLQLAYPRDSRGGLADVFVNGIKRERISFYSPQSDFGGRLALRELGPGANRVELRGVQGRIYFDGLLLDGTLLPVGTQLSEETETFSGTLGPSVSDLMEARHSIEVGVETTTIRANLGWTTGGVDLDLYLLDPDGNTIASGATLANPERLEAAVSAPGTYTFRVTGFVNALTTYTLQSTQVRVVPES
jgi:serine protease AprX